MTTDLHITGKVAQFGRGHHRRRLQEADGAVRRQPEHDARRAGHRPVDRCASGGAEAAAGNGDESVSALGADTPQAADQAPAAAPVPAPTATAEPADPAPRVRKIDSPASEPVDLAGVAGPAILKRLAPVLGVLLIVLLLVLRRRR